MKKLKKLDTAYACYLCGQHRAPAFNKFCQRCVGVRKVHHMAYKCYLCGRKNAPGARRFCASCVVKRKESYKLPTKKETMKKKLNECQDGHHQCQSVYLNVMHATIRRIEIICEDAILEGKMAKSPVSQVKMALKVLLNEYEEFEKDKKKPRAPKKPRIDPFKTK